MFDAVRNNRRIVQLFLVLITIPFALFGIDFYMKGGGDGGAVAKVGSTKVTEAELAEAVRNQQDRLREQLGQAYDPAMAEQPEFRSNVLDSLINQKAIAQAVEKSRVEVPDELVISFLERQTEFQENGKYSRQKVETFLRERGMTNDLFIERVRESIAQQLLLGPIIQSAYTSKASLRNWLTTLEEERVVSELRLEGKGFQQQAKLDPNAAKAYYDSNRARFQTPERVKVEYVTLSADDLGKQAEVTEAEAKKWYDANQSQYQQVEERRASHILIGVAENAAGAEKDAAKKKAEQLLAQIKANPSTFARLAKENSKDEVSAAQGGDLGFFRRGDMVKSFEDAAFSLKPQEVSGVVESQYGYHIIMLTEVRGGGVKTFEAVKGEILEDLRKKAVASRLSEAAAGFSDLVFSQAESLQPVATKYGLKIQQSDWIDRAAPQPGVLGNPKLVAAIFSPESIKSRRNTEAIDAGNNILVSARVIDHKPVADRPFEEVKPTIEAQLLHEAAAKLALADGQAKLEQLRAGQAVSGAWAASRPVTRISGDLNEQTRKAIFGAASQKLPSYVGVETPGGYSIFKVEKVTTPTIADNDPRLQQAAEEYGRATSEEDLRAFVSGLRQRFDAKVTRPITVSSTQPNQENQP